MLHTGYPLGNDDLGGAGNLAGESRPDLGVGSGIHRAGGVVQDKHLGMLKQRPGNTQPLFLTAGHIGPAPFDAGLITIREALNKLIGAGRPTGLDTLLLSGIRIAPAQVVQNGAGKQGVLLEHH